MSVDVVIYDRSVDFAIAAWLDAKHQRSQSERTHKSYRETIDAFRADLRSRGLDLNADPTLVATVAQKWCGWALTKETVSASTYNTRLAILSSFYSYCVKMELLVKHNPISRVARRASQEYASAQPLDAKEVKSKLDAIDRDSSYGKRDYALLLIALTTGRRLSEIATMRWEDVSASETGNLVITWKRTKGGKTMKDKLSLSVSMALADYRAVTRAEFVWLGHNETGHLTPRSLQHICKRRLGTSKFHSLRHTFAHLMEDAGAKVSVIQYRLGHSDIGTTGRYLQAMRSEENEYADTLAQLFS